MTMLKHLKANAYGLVCLVALLAIAIVLLSCESHLLWKIQEKNLFLCSTSFLKEQMVVPGGLLTYVGTFLTQFLFYPVLGVTVLCAMWLLLLWLMRRTFRVCDRWAPLLLVPVASMVLW